MIQLSLPDVDIHISTLTYFVTGGIENGKCSDYKIETDRENDTFKVW